MAYYNDELDIYPSELSIFKRDLEIANKNTRQHKPLNWYYKIKVDGLPRAKEGSTKTHLKERVKLNPVSLSDLPKNASPETTVLTFTRTLETLARQSRNKGGWRVEHPRCC